MVRLNVPSFFIGAVVAVVLVTFLSRLHLDSFTALVRRNGAANHENFRLIMDALKHYHMNDSMLHEVLKRGGTAHAGGHRRDPKHDESSAELAVRRYPEHIASLRDPELHRQKKDQWEEIGYSRPYLLRQREMECSGSAEATLLSRTALQEVRRIIDDPLLCCPANFSAAVAMLEQSLALDPSCLPVRLNFIMLKVAMFSNVDTPWDPRELERLFEFHERTVDVATKLLAAPEGPGALTQTAAKVFFWRGLLLEYRSNATSEQAGVAYRKAFQLDAFLSEEHIHPTRKTLPPEILRPITREADWWFRRGLMCLLFYYEYAPAMGAYTPITYADTQRFLRDWHVKLDNALPPYVFAVIVRVYRLVFDGGMLRGVVGAYKGAATHESNSECLNLWYNIRIRDMVSRLAGTPVRATYGYTAGYEAGDELKPHTDRKACEFTLTTLIQAHPHPSYCPLFTQVTPWEIDRKWIGRFEDTTIKYGDVINLQPQLNQWLILRGRAKPHFRPPLAAGASCTTFLQHYVPEGEPES